MRSTVPQHEQGFGAVLNHTLSEQRRLSLGRSCIGQFRTPVQSIVTDVKTHGRDILRPIFCGIGKPLQFFSGNADRPSLWKEESVSQKYLSLVDDRSLQSLQKSTAHRQPDKEIFLLLVLLLLGSAEKRKRFS